MKLKLFNLESHQRKVTPYTQSNNNVNNYRFLIRNQRGHMTGEFLRLKVTIHLEYYVHRKYQNTDEMIFLDEGQLRVLNHGTSQKAMLKDVLQAKSKWQRETWNLRNEENSAEMERSGQIH